MIDWTAISAEIAAMTTEIPRISTPSGAEMVGSEHIQHIVWNKRLVERHALLSPGARRAIENRVVFELAELDVPTVWFHTVYMGPLVILCSLSDDTADIGDIETEAEHRASFESTDEEEQPRRRWTRY